MMALEPSWQMWATFALIAVLALMVVGQGLIRTGALDESIRVMTRRFQRSPAPALCLTLAAIAALSAFINNTPIVVIFIPSWRQLPNA